jgi:hypothetical protein
MKIKKIAIMSGVATALTAAAIYAIILTNESLKNIGDAFDIEED